MLICIVAGACCVQGFFLKRKLDRGHECFAHMAGEITEFYFDNKVAGKMVKDAMRECLAQKGNEEKCLLGKRKDFAEVYVEEGAKGIDAILGGLIHVGTAVLQHCGGLENYAMKICAGYVLQGIKNHFTCTEQCDVFIDLFGEKAAECEELDLLGPKEGKEGHKESGEGSKESGEGSQESGEESKESGQGSQGSKDGSQESEEEREVKRILGELKRLRSFRIDKYKK